MGSRTPTLVQTTLWSLLFFLSACTGLIEQITGASDSDREGNAVAGDDDGDDDGGGAELPDDVTPEQLADGKKTYDTMCASCHGADGLGGPFDVPLTRDMGFDNLVAYIDEYMPKGSPEVCVDECAYNVGAYVQKTFVIPAGSEGGGDKPVVCTGETPAPRMLRLLTRREYQNTVRDLLGVDAPDTSNLPVEPRVRGFDNNANAAVVTSRHVDEYVVLAEQLANSAVQTRRAALVSCDGAQAACPRETVQKLGLRAFRRPLDEDELTALSALFESDLTEGNFDTGLALAVQAMLISPNFLYRSEMGEAQADGTFRLTPYETASALSYTLLGTMPDDALLEAAASGRLSTPSELEAQARRLLDDPRAQDQLADFVTQWLRTDGLLQSNKDTTIYPTFTDDIREAMAEEQRRFATHLFFETEGSFRDLLLADYVFVNPALANFYGLPAPAGGDFAETPAPASSGRGGLLGLGAVSASHAHSNESSPIKRGLFVRDRLLCQDLPPPPANLDTTPPGLDFSLTTRERFAQHTSDAACSGCHQYIDGVGFGFEGFDGVGARREVENGLPIDTSGELVGLSSLKDTDKHSFDGTRELAGLLAESDSAQSCLARQYYRYARGYQEDAAAECSIARLADDFKGGLTLRELLVAPARLENFLVRK